MVKVIINIWSVETGSNIKGLSSAMFVQMDSSSLLYKRSAEVAINFQSDARFAQWLARKFHLPGWYRRDIPKYTRDIDLLEVSCSIICFWQVMSHVLQ